MVLKVVHAMAWFAGLLVFPWLCVIVYNGSWISLPAAFVLALVSALIQAWTGKNLGGLKGALSSPTSL